jgi:hypothetical protein
MPEKNRRNSGPSLENSKTATSLSGSVPGYGLPASNASGVITAPCHRRYFTLERAGAGKIRRCRRKEYLSD